ncbi:hypothetical protein A2U01_0072635, partial [Trifolium medium]|nr:hypothetical protein [Trifolium medium]
RMDGDVLEVDCSRFGGVCSEQMNWSNKLWEPLNKELLDQVFVVGASLRLAEYNEEYSKEMSFRGVLA